jgi:hypothetical protein
VSFSLLLRCGTDDERRGDWPSAAKCIVGPCYRCMQCDRFYLCEMHMAEAPFRQYRSHAFLVFTRPSAAATQPLSEVAPNYRSNGALLLRFDALWTVAASSVLEALVGLIGSVLRVEHTPSFSAMSELVMCSVCHTARPPDGTYYKSARDTLINICASCWPNFAWKDDDRYGLHRFIFSMLHLIGCVLSVV